METVVFLISAAVILSGALGVIFSKNPVHSALFRISLLALISAGIRYKYVR